MCVKDERVEREEEDVLHVLVVVEERIAVSPQESRLVGRRKKRVERTNYQSFFLFPLPPRLFTYQNKGKEDQQTTDLLLSCERSEQ